jgi:hypothetical protein
MIPRVGDRKATCLPRPFLDLVSQLNPRVEKVVTKDVQILKGDEDGPVPWSASEAFMARLPRDRVEVVGFPSVGHEFPDDMAVKAASWIVDWRERR